MDSVREASCDAFVARAPAAPGAEGPLRGLRLAVKDNIAVQGLPFTAGVPCFAARVAETDAFVVRRFRAAGATIVGVTHTDAGGLGVVTPAVTNPRFADRIAGGSSGGSAAAVAAGEADIALGTDTGGSVRIPAACCGLFAFKPTHGRVPADGVWPLSPELEDVGIIASDLALLSRAAHVLLDAPREATGETVRIGVDWDRLARCDEEVAAAFRAAMAALERAGCVLMPVPLPSREAVGKAHAILVLRDALRVYTEVNADEDALGTTIHRSLALARTVSPEAIDEALRTRRALRQQWRQALAGVDCVALPTLAIPVPARGARRARLGQDEVAMTTALTAETAPANLFGAPAVSLPIPGTGHSLQLVGPGASDARVLSRAARVHALLEGH